MKLRELNGAIRKVDGNLKVRLATSAGVLELPLVKSHLLAALKDHYGEDNMVMTGLMIEDGCLRHTDEEARILARGNFQQAVEDLDDPETRAREFNEQIPSTPAPAADDLDDLLG